MIKTKWWYIALWLTAGALGGCGGASEFDEASPEELDAAAADLEAPAGDVEASASDVETASAAPAPGAAAEAVGQSQQALGNLCKNVRIEVKNLYEESNGARPDIKVTALSFFNADKGSSGKWSKQSVPNRVVGYGDDYPYVEHLEGADGDTITRWRVYHKHDLGNGWSNEVYQEINTTDVNCRDGMTVELTVTT